MSLAGFNPVFQARVAQLAPQAVDVDRQCIVIDKIFILPESAHNLFPAEHLAAMFDQKMQNTQFVARQRDLFILIKKLSLSQMKHRPPVLYDFSLFFAIGIRAPQ